MGIDIPLIEHPAIAIAKQVSVTSFTASGQVVSYTYTVTNNGDVPLHDVTVDDSKLGAVCGAPFALPLAAKRTCTARHVTTTADVAAGRVANTATVTGVAPAAGTVQAQVALVIMLRAVPGIAITKHANVTSFAAAGTVITYSYTVTNTGNVPLHGVAVVDSKAGAVPCPTATLGVGASMTCTARYTASTADVSAGHIANTATVTGTTTTGTTVTSKASLAIPLIVPVTG